MIVPATATKVIITIPSQYPQYQPKPTVIRWEKEKGFWQRYWSGQGENDDTYRENQHDWGAKGGPQGEVTWSVQEGHTVVIS
jgi:hypothetical protein